MRVRHLELSDPSLVDLPDNQISLAWSHLYQLLDEPSCPIPEQLSHLNEQDWTLLALSLDRQLYLRQHLPLQ
jgi:hypothetical protein